MLGLYRFIRWNRGLTVRGGSSDRSLLAQRELKKLDALNGSSRSTRAKLSKAPADTWIERFCSSQV